MDMHSVYGCVFALGLYKDETHNKTWMQMGHIFTDARVHAQTRHTSQSRCESKTYADELGLLMAFLTVNPLSTAGGLAQ